MDWKIKFITKNYIFSKVKFITDESQLENHAKNHPLDICFYNSCNKIIKSPLIMSEYFGNQPKKWYILL